MAPPKPKGNDHAATRKIPVPTNYRQAAKYLRQAVHEKKSIKTDLLNDSHFRAGRTIMHRLMTNTPQINAILNDLDLLKKEPKLNEWLARVLICELLFGRGNLIGASLPVECIRRYEAEIRDVYDKTKEENPPLKKIEAPRYVRLNTTNTSLEDAKRLLSEEGWTLVEGSFAHYRPFLDRVQALGDAEYMVDFHFDDVLVFPHSSKRAWSQMKSVGSRFFLQNKACVLPTFLLKPAKKSVVLDMCSAPGLKATHLACLMKNSGRVYAVERDEKRYKLLCKFVADFGVIKTIHGDCLNITNDEVPGVEYILIDPSCSGSGMNNRLAPEEPVDRQRLYKLAGLQYKLLMHAMTRFPDAKRIVYSTCSLHEEENEQVVAGVLRNNSHFKLLDARQELGKEWLHVGSKKYGGIGERCLYARSEVDLTIGMFVAVFERCAAWEVNEFYIDRSTVHNEAGAGNTARNDSGKPQSKKMKRDN